MCGIYGAIGLDQLPATRGEIERMGGLLTHRGPHSQKTLVQGSASLGCTRLRIVDLTLVADGPLRSEVGNLSLTCNGEIYNSAQLRARYPDYPYTTRSDLEAIFPLYLDKGLEGLSEINGMFALALWDENHGRFLLMRDRSGEKPLFYAGTPTNFLFASEMQSLLGTQSVSNELDPASLQDYLCLGYVRSPRTIFRDIRQVPAGSMLILENDALTISNYWEPQNIARFERDRRTLRPTPTELLELLRSSVLRQATADVKRGVYLSGGLDSSLLAALLCEIIDPAELTGFTVAFTASSFDESHWASYVAKRLGIQLNRVTLDEPRLERAWRRAITEIADPISDPALLPTIALGELAGQSVNVVFSGEGADELFGGYPTYLGHTLAHRVVGLPSILRKALAAGIQRLPTSHQKVTVSFLAKRFIKDVDSPWVERHLRWFGPGAGKLSLDNDNAIEDLARGFAEDQDTLPVAEAAMLLDYSTYLRDNLLVKLDRGTMLSSVESRAPFLDPDVLRHAWSLPMSSKIKGTQTKVLLKRAAAEVLPRDVIHRRKRGLSLPIASWLNCGLAAEVDRLLDPGRLRRQGLFDASGVAEHLKEHREHRADHSRMLWNVVHLQSWLETWAPSQAGA